MDRLRQLEKSLESAINLLKLYQQQIENYKALVQEMEDYISSLKHQEEE